MKRREFLQLAGLGLIGLAGCSSARGHKSSRAIADLKITNHTAGGIHVYIDGSHIGDVPAFDVTYFHIVDGTHTVEVREQGDTIYYNLGTHYFGGSRIRLHYYG